MYFNDTYYMYDSHTRKTFKRRFKDTCVDDMQYTRQGLLNAINTWNRLSVITMDSRYIYYTEEVRV